MKMTPCSEVIEKNYMVIEHGECYRNWCRKYFKTVDK